jgi:prolipoprotein diacylglyceryltransferase
MLLRRPKWQGRVFYLYLVAYGVFRFLHEWVRDTPKWLGVVSGYQVLALVMILIGWRTLRRGDCAAKHSSIA